MEEEHKLAEVWQVERDGKMAFVLRVMPVEQYADPTSRAVWDTFVCLAVEDALKQIQIELAVTPT